MDFDVDPEKFKKLADEMDAQWKAMQADPRVQQVMSGWSEALTSEQEDPKPEYHPGEAEWWCYRCDYGFTGFVGEDGSEPKCSICGQNDEVEVVNEYD